MYRGSVLMYNIKQSVGSGALQKVAIWAEPCPVLWSHVVVSLRQYNTDQPAAS